MSNSGCPTSRGRTGQGSRGQSGQGSRGQSDQGSRVKSGLGHIQVCKADVVEELINDGTTHEQVKCVIV